MTEVLSKSTGGIDGYCPPSRPCHRLDTEQFAFARAITPGFPRGRGHGRSVYTSISMEIVY